MEICTMEEQQLYQNEVKIAKTVETLDELIKELHKIFSKDVVDVEQVTQLMLSYKSNPAEWRRYAKFDRYRYTRNLVDEGNGKFNLMVLCWGEGHASAIHDHADAHCFMKMLKGDLEEIRFSWPEETKHDEQVEVGDIAPECRTTSSCHYEDQPEYKEMNETGRYRLRTNEVCYINDSLGLHRVENPSHVDTAVSLHLYCPPFNACHVFNQQTGHKTKAQVTFWSKYGQKRSREIQEARAPEDN